MDFLPISWQFLTVFGVFLLLIFVIFALLWYVYYNFCLSFPIYRSILMTFCGLFKANFFLFFQFTGQSYCINNHIPSILISPKYSKCQFRHFACLYIYIFMFHPHFACSSWRDHYNDQGDQNWSRFWYRMVSFWESCCIRY